MEHPTQPFEPGNSYVLGFAFGADGNAVLLIQKNRPKWQAGKVNGVGGKIEETDWCVQAAMVREFKEETGITTEDVQWEHFATHEKPATFNLDPDSYTLNVLATVLTHEQMAQLTEPTDELPYWHDLWSIHLVKLLDPHYAVNGTLMYIAMALNHMGRTFHTMTIEKP